MRNAYSPRSSMWSDRGSIASYRDAARNPGVVRMGFSGRSVLFHVKAVADNRRGGVMFRMVFFGTYHMSTLNI